MERETPSFTQETVVTGEPVETQVRVRASSSYVRLVMVGETGWVGKKEFTIFGT